MFMCQIRLSGKAESVLTEAKSYCFWRRGGANVSLVACTRAVLDVGHPRYSNEPT